MRGPIVCLFVAAACGGSGGGGSDAAGSDGASTDGPGADAAPPGPHYCTARGSTAAWCDDFDEAGQDVDPFGFSDVQTDPSVTMTVITDGGDRSLSIMQSGTEIATGAGMIVSLAGRTSALAQARFQVPAHAPGSTVLLKMYLGASLGGDAQVRIDGAGALSLEVHGDTTAGPFPTGRAMAAGEWVTLALLARWQPGSQNADVAIGLGPDHDDIILDYTPIALPDVIGETFVRAGMQPSVAASRTVLVDDVAIFVGP